MKKLILVALCLMMVPAIGLAQEPQLNLKAGTMQLGGTLAFSIDMAIPEEGDSTTGFKLNVAPTVGYFLMDNLELEGGLLFAMGFGDLYENAGKDLGFGVGAKYYIPMGRMAVYVGADIGMNFTMPDEGDTTKTLAIMVPAGIVYAMNANVALDLGLRFIYNMGLDDQGSFMTIPIGYFGVQAFF
ncbi:MAG: porin family protein [Myxococcales bacterium]|nr:porin family protein [Myxococcales bacterium]